MFKYKGCGDSVVVSLFPILVLAQQHIESRHCNECFVSVARECHARFPKSSLDAFLCLSICITISPTDAPNFVINAVNIGY